MLFNFLYQKTWGGSAHPCFFNIISLLCYSTLHSFLFLSFDHCLVEFYKYPLRSSVTCQISWTISVSTNFTFDLTYGVRNLNRIEAYRVNFKRLFLPHEKVRFGKLTYCNEVHSSFLLLFHVSKYNSNF